LLILLFNSCNTNNNIKNNDSKEDLSSNVIDTLIAGDYILKFENADSFPPNYPYDLYKEKLKLIDSLSIFNSHEEAIAFQNFLAKKYGDKYFYENDTSLVLKLDNGKKLFFPFWDEERQEGFNFEYYYENIGYYLLHVQWYEGDCRMLVNKKNGYKRYIGGLPYISNDGKKIMVIYKDLDAQYSFNGIQLFSVLQDSLKLEFSRYIDSWGPDYIKWINENQVLIKRDSLSSHDFKLLTIEPRNKK